VHGGGYWEGQGVCIADDPENPWGIRGDLFGYVAGLMSTIGCLEGHNVKLVEVAAMRGTHQPSLPRLVMVFSATQRAPSPLNLHCPSPHGTSPWVPLNPQTPDY
jgi:hypothetical protein